MNILIKNYPFCIKSFLVYISPFKCSRKSKGLRSRSFLPSAFCFCLLLTSFLLVSEVFFCFFIHWQAKSLSVHEKNFRQSLHWQAFCLSVNEFYIFLPVFDIILHALTSFLLVSEWKKYTASTTHIHLIWSLTSFLLVSEFFSVTDKLWPAFCLSVKNFSVTDKQNACQCSFWHYWQEKSLSARL